MFRKRPALSARPSPRHPKKPALLGSIVRAGGGCGGPHLRSSRGGARHRQMRGEALRPAGTRTPPPPRVPFRPATLPAPRRHLQPFCAPRDVLGDAAEPQPVTVHRGAAAGTGRGTGAGPDAAKGRPGQQAGARPQPHAASSRSLLRSHAACLEPPGWLTRDCPAAHDITARSLGHSPRGCWLLTQAPRRRRIPGSSPAFAWPKHRRRRRRRKLRAEAVAHRHLLPPLARSLSNRHASGALIHQSQTAAAAALAPPTAPLRPPRAHSSPHPLECGGNVNGTRKALTVCAQKPGGPR